MLKTIATLAFVLLGAQAQAAEVRTVDLSQPLLAVADVDPLGLNWKVGDSTDYKLSGGIMQGTARMFVREETAQGFWLQQDLDVGMFGKQKVEVLYDKTNAKVLELIVNGQKQTPPEAADTEIVETKHDRVTVPKGEFECMYVKMRDKKNNQESEAWINPALIPVSGMIKTISQSQMGPVTLELTGFEKK